MNEAVKSILDRAVAHAHVEDLRHVDVPEWGEGADPLRVYYRPMTGRDMDRLGQQGKPDEIGTNNCRIVAMKALNEDGERLFKTMDAHVLAEKADLFVVNRIANAISGAPNEAQAEKN